MPSIVDRIKAFLSPAGPPPADRMTIVNPMAEQATLANTMTTDRIWEIIESAKGGDPRDLFALYRDILLSDSHLLSEFDKRKLALLGDPLVIQPADKKNPDDVKAQKSIQAIIDNYKAPNPEDISSCPWVKFCAHLMDSILWPVAIGEKVYQPSTIPGLQYELKELVMVPEHLITYQGNPQDFTYKLKIRDTDANGYILGSCKLLDKSRYMVHRGHLLSTHDTWGGPLRSLLFWWLLGSMSRDWWSTFLEKYGAPFLVGKYDTADDASRSVMERAFSLAVKIGGLVVSRGTEVELVQAASAQTGEAFEKFHEICNREKTKVITGQTLTASNRGSSFGDAGKAKNEEGVRQDIRTFDGVMLAQTIENQLCAQLLQINGLKGRVKVVWGGENPQESVQLSSLILNLFQAGLQPSDDAIEVIGDRIGFALQRAPAPTAAPGGFPPTPLSPHHLHALATVMQSHEASNDIARAAAPALSRAFRGSFAPIRGMIALSKSPAELEQSIRYFYADYDPSRQAALIHEALTAYAANGVHVPDITI